MGAMQDGEGGLSLLPPKDKKNANMHTCLINRHVNRRGTKPEVNLVRWAQTKVCGFSCVPMNYVGVCDGKRASLSVTASLWNAA